MEEKQKLLKVREVAWLLGINRQAVYKLVRKKEIPHLRLPVNRIRFRLAEVEEWIDSKSIGQQSNEKGEGYVSFKDYKEERGVYQGDVEKAQCGGGENGDGGISGFSGEVISPSAS